MSESIFDWIFENRKTVLSCYVKSGESPKKTWDRLTGMFPELDGLTKFNSFKTYLKPAAEMLNRVKPEPGTGGDMERVFEERDRLQAELDELTERFNAVKQSLESEREKLRTREVSHSAEIDRLKAEIEKAKAGAERLNDPVKHPEPDGPTNIEGWTLGKSGAYYSMFKFFGRN